MISEFLELASDWNFRDTWMATTAALAAMACSIPGCFLLLRRQSLMGDALSHTSLLGIVGAILFANWLRLSGWISPESYSATRHVVMFGGAMAVGVFSALLTEWIQRLGRVEASAALGVVFTSLFALGLLLIRVAADDVHIDPDCVFYGTIESSAISVRGEPPAPAITNGIMLLINLLLLFVGTFMDMTPAVLIFTPIFLPIAITLGIDPVHFGIILIANLCIGLCTPPVGTCLFLGCGVGKTTIARVTPYMIPFFIAMFVGLMLISYVPALSMWLPSVFGL